MIGGCDEPGNWAEMLAIVRAIKIHESNFICFNNNVYLRKQKNLKEFRLFYRW